MMFEGTGLGLTGSSYIKLCSDSIVLAPLRTPLGRAAFLKESYFRARISTILTDSEKTAEIEPT